MRRQSDRNKKIDSNNNNQREMKGKKIDFVNKYTEHLFIVDETTTIKLLKNYFNYVQFRGNENQIPNPLGGAY